MEACRMKRLVVIESPYASTDCFSTDQHLQYLRLAVQDSLSRGEAPFASHGFYTQYLNDNIFPERLAGILAGLDWGKHADLIALYCDMGVSDNMSNAVAYYKHLGIPVERRVVDDIERVMQIKNS